MKKQSMILLLGCVLLSTSGCYTCRTVYAAKKETHKDEKGEVVVDKKWEPWYYGLVPFAVAGDILTSPFQIFYIVTIWTTHPC